MNVECVEFGPQRAAYEESGHQRAAYQEPGHQRAAYEESGHERAVCGEKHHTPLPTILDGEIFRVLLQEGDKITAQCCVCPAAKKPIRGTRLSTGNFLSHILRVHPMLKNRVEEKRRERRGMKRQYCAAGTEPKINHYNNRWQHSLQVTECSPVNNSIAEPIVMIREDTGTCEVTEQLDLKKEPIQEEDSMSGQLDPPVYIHVVPMSNLQDPLEYLPRTLDDVAESDTQHQNTDDRPMLTAAQEANLRQEMEEQIEYDAEEQSRFEHQERINYEREEVSRVSHIKAVDRKSAAQVRLANVFERQASATETTTKALDKQAAATDVIAKALEQQAAAACRIVKALERQATCAELKADAEERFVVAFQKRAEAEMQRVQVESAITTALGKRGESEMSVAYELERRAEAEKVITEALEKRARAEKCIAHEMEKRAEVEKTITSALEKRAEVEWRITSGRDPGAPFMEIKASLKPV